jgi:purine nucleoside permease
MFNSLRMTLAFLALGSFVSSIQLRADDRIPIKVIILSCFEVGNDTGDAPGEFQYFAEREHLTKVIQVPGAPHPLVHNDQGLYGSVSSVVKTTPSDTPDHLSCVETSQLIMALCLDPKLDLRKTYWIINGIAGIDPASGSIGSAAWAKHVVDGDAMREVDDTEVPAGWPYGLFAIGTMKPNTLPVADTKNGGWGGAKLTYTMDYALNPKLAEWAYQTSKGVTLPDSDALKAYRAKYVGFPQALQPPQIIMGDSLGSTRYWHGPKRTQWARDWVKLWTNGQGTFTTTAMEHQDYMNTLTDMAKAGFVDINRVMMLRGASNYCMPPPGASIESTIGDESVGTVPAFEADYQAGTAVAHELLKNWAVYKDTIPSPKN